VLSLGEEYYIKYHFLPEVGVRNFTNAEATAMCGLDPDFAKRDLWQHIDKGGEVVWKAYIQIMTPEQTTYATPHKAVVRPWSFVTHVFFFACAGRAPMIRLM
jgi:catalase